jgi:uncharacterized protein YcbK (DUF882 family)
MSVYFKEIEENMNVDFLAKLDEARECAGIPFIINSAFRTPEKNAEVGGKPNSSHLRGLAVDIKVKDSRTRSVVLNSLIGSGFTRMGIGDTFIHVDMDTEKSQNVIWTY